METYTLPHPLEPDIEIIRRMGNLSESEEEVPSNCSGGGGIARCANQTLMALADEQKSWMYASQDILYVAFPVVIVWGVVSGVVCAAVLTRQVRASHDGYLLGFVVASVLLLTCGGALKLHDYIGHSNAYQHSYGYVKSLNDWLWYTALWILVVMTLERGMTESQRRNKTLCTPGQAGVVVVMIFCVCLVSALPQFWEYEVTETFDYGTNQTIAMSQLSKAASTPEYRIMYFWYTVTITVFLPYPIMLVMTVLLSRGMTHAQQSRRRLSLNHCAGSILNRKVSEELHVTRLFIVLILLYILLTGPVTFLIIVNGITPQWSWPADTLYTGLYPILEFAFYFYFAMIFLLLCSYSDRFRYRLARTCCGCCVKPKKHVRTSARSARKVDKPDNYYIR